MIKKTAKPIKIVEWSEEDQCYIGTAPGLILGGVHGKNETKVFQELCKVVDEAEKLLKKEGRPIPSMTLTRKYSGKIPLRVSPELHKKVAIKAFQEGESINKYIERVIS